MLRFSPVSTGGCILACVIHPVWADADILLKSRGIGLTVHSRDQDIRVTDFTVQNPVLAGLLPANTKDRVKLNNKLQSVGVKLDYQVQPNLSLFGEVAQVRGTATARLSAIPRLRLSDMTFDAKGQLYNVGATISGKRDRYFGALTYVHTFADTHGAIEGSSVNTLLPTVGVLTDVGVFNLGLIYQKVKIDYVGTVDLPGFGAVSATVNGESAKKLAYRAGYQTLLGKDVYLNASAGFGGRKEARLELGKRF